MAEQNDESAEVRVLKSIRHVLLLLMIEIGVLAGWGILSGVHVGPR